MGRQNHEVWEVKPSGVLKQFLQINLNLTVCGRNLRSHTKFRRDWLNACYAKKTFFLTTHVMYYIMEQNSKKINDTGQRVLNNRTTGIRRPKIKNKEATSLAKALSSEAQHCSCKSRCELNCFFMLQVQGLLEFVKHNLAHYKNLTEFMKAEGGAVIITRY